MNSNPICHPSPANKMKCSFLDYIQLLMISRACQWTWTPSITCFQAKKLNAHILIMFNFWCWPGWSMDSNPIHHPSAGNKMKCFFLDYVHFWWSARLVNGLKPHLPPFSRQKNEMLIFWLCSLLMIGQAGQWTWTPSTTRLEPKKMKCSFLDYVHFWWSAWLIDELEPHLPPLSYQKNEMLNFWLHSTSDDQPNWSIDSKSICQPSPANKMKCFFLDYVHFWWSARLVDGLKPHLPPFSSQKNEMLTFGLCSFWMISQAGQWTQTPSSTSLQPKQWNAHFCITFNIWCWPDWSMNLNLIHHSSPAKISNAHFWVTFNFWWLVGLFDELKPHLPSLSSQ